MLGKLAPFGFDRVRPALRPNRPVLLVRAYSSPFQPIDASRADVTANVVDEPRAPKPHCLEAHQGRLVFTDVIGSLPSKHYGDLACGTGALDIGHASGVG